MVQVGIQFLAGYRDLTLRDVAHVGHGALLAQDPDWHGRPELAAVIRGALVGLATTEPATDPQGEEELAAVTTRAVRTPDGWEISGRKAWVSRVLEADAFVVFARSPEHLGAFYVPAGAAGLTAEPAPRPDGGEAGRGWSWGDLVLDQVAVPPTAVLGASVGGVAVFRRHLADYRPLVAATCLGAAAAAVDDWVERVLAAPNAGSGLPDPVVERLGDLRGRVLLALGGLFTGAAGPGAVDSSWSKMVKAQAVNTAIEVVRAVVHADGDRARRGAGRRAGRGTPGPGRADRVRGRGRCAGRRCCARPASGSCSTRRRSWTRSRSRPRRCRDPVCPTDPVSPGLPAGLPVGSRCVTEGFYAVQHSVVKTLLSDADRASSATERGASGAGPDRARRTTSI